MTPNQKSKIKNQKLAIALLSSLFTLASSNPARADDHPLPPQVQSAVDRGLDYLAKTQEANGAWPTGSGRTGPTAAVTSLAALAFMARGHVPGQGPYGDNLNRAVDFILSIQQPNGLLCAHTGSPVMYDHGISTVMLCEAYGMLQSGDDTRHTRTKAAISKAVRLILDAQKIPKSDGYRGGWRYMPDAQDSDISVTGWQLMALRSAANIGASVPPSAIDAGINFVKNCAVPSGGFFYNTAGNVNPALTGTGILALELLGQHNSKQALAGGDYLIEHPITQASQNQFYFYTIYYCSQAAWQLGPRYWDAINPILRKSILDRQSPNGAWNIPDGDPEHQAGATLGTSMAILALTVPYRYLPLYQR
jgi:prenyltransferase beta subunit